MKLKRGVRISGISPEIIVGLAVCDPIFTQYDVEMVVTSACDSKHSKGSLHYIGHAVDLRTRDLPEDARPLVVGKMKEKLGSDFDVILEGNHIHMEFQPKTGINL